MDEKELVKQELYKAITYFIERQDLVAQAMLDLGLNLNLIGQFGALAWVSGTWVLDDDLTSWLANLDKLFVGEEFVPGEEALIEAIKRNAERQYPQRGTWRVNDEWEYYLHGGGCRLTNKKTGESIDWDCPNLKTFDKYFFRHHLEWQLDSPIHKGNLQHTTMWIKKNGINSIEELIEEMASEGKFEEYQIMEGLKYIPKGE